MWRCGTVAAAYSQRIKTLRYLTLFLRKYVRRNDRLILEMKQDNFKLLSLIFREQ